MHRRTFLHTLGGTLAALNLPASAATPPTAAEADSIRGSALAFLAEFKVSGLSIAFGRDGAVDFEAGYGLAAPGEPLTPAHRFRIASVSKPITAVGIMKCIEAGRLKAGQTVLGPGGVLGDAFGTGLSERMRAVTVDHLLTHTCGGWGNSKADPMFQQASLGQADLIRWTLVNRPLENDPGSHYAYSNFGYCLLGRVLEKVTGKPYETWIKDEVLTPCGARGMEIGGSTLADRRPHEVVYDATRGNPYDLKPARMDAHGGWIATAADLVRFAGRLRASPAGPALLTADSWQSMAAATTANANYARGWAVNRAGNTWHNGGMSGTATILVRTAKGNCWAALLNGNPDKVAPALDALMWKLAAKVPAWNA